jgi:hypothetical protein
LIVWEGRILPVYALYIGIDVRKGRPRESCSRAVIIAKSRRLVKSGMRRRGWQVNPTTRRVRRYRENFLYLIRCGMTVSVPSRRILSFS